MAENESSGNAGQGSHGRFVFATAAYVHFKAADGYTRQPSSFNDGWRSRFWGLDFAGNGNVIGDLDPNLLAAGAGAVRRSHSVVQGSASSNDFASNYIFGYKHPRVLSIKYIK